MRTFILFLLLSTSLCSQNQKGQDLNDPGVIDHFGRQAFMSSDGNIVAILARPMETSGNVRIYEFNNNTWQTLGVDEEGGHFETLQAHGIALSPDGRSLAVNYNNTLKMYFYDSGVWAQRGSTLSYNPEDETSVLGHIISFSYDGTTVAVGAPNYVPPTTSGSGDFNYIPIPNHSGLVSIFKFDGDSWVKIGDSIIEEPFSLSAKSIDLSEDGNTIAISNAFSIKVFENVSDSWVLKGSEIIGMENEPKSVSLSAKGDVVIVGEREFTNNLIQRGRISIYEFNSDWVQKGSNIYGENQYDLFGWDVSISDNGLIIAVGALGINSIENTKEGFVKIYGFNDGDWVQAGNTIENANTDDLFGTQISLASNGKTVAIGAPEYIDESEETGLVQVYDLGEIPLIQLLSQVLSAEEYGFDEFSIYPNPVSNELNLNYLLHNENIHIEVFNVLGEKIYESDVQKFNSINTSAWVDGFYMLSVTESSSNKRRTIKFIVKH